MLSKKKLIASSICSAILLSTIVVYSQPNWSGIGNQLDSQKTQVKLIINGVMALAALGGAIYVGIAFFNKDQDLRQKITYFVGGLVVWGIINTIF